MYAPPLIKPWLATFDTKRDLVADLGCGPIVYSADVLCVDGVNYPNVHLVADFERLPIRGESLAGVISFGVLEHVPNPQAHVAEIRRILAPGGRVFCFIPSSRDFTRRLTTISDTRRRACANCSATSRCSTCALPVGRRAGCCGCVQEWLAMVLSLGSMRLYRLLVPLMWLLSPLKYLDILLSRHPAAGAIASGFVIEAHKRG